MSFYYMEKKDAPRAVLPVNAVRYSPETLPSMKQTGCCFLMHNHDVLEILAVTEGRMRVRLDREYYTLHAGDVLVVNPFVLHEGDAADADALPSYYCVTMNLTRLLPYPNTPLYADMTALTEEKGEFVPYAAGDANAVLFASCKTMWESADSPNGSPDACRLLSAAYAMLSELFASRFRTHSSADGYRRNTAFMRKVSAYMLAHSTEPITSADVASAMFMTPSGFCHAFRNHFGTSFTVYLGRYRVMRASREYICSELSLAGIAEAVGFTDYCYFSRSFRKYIGVSAAEYFGRWKKRG